MLFGLGPGEILVIALIIALVAGPAAIPKAIRAAKKAQEVRQKLNPASLLSELGKLDADPKRASKKKRPKASKPRAEDA